MSRFFIKSIQIANVTKTKESQAAKMKKTIADGWNRFLITFLFLLISRDGGFPIQRQDYFWKHFSAALKLSTTQRKKLKIAFDKIQKLINMTQFPMYEY